MQIFLFLALFIALVAGVFAMQNSATVEITFLAWKFNSSLAIVLLIAVALGALFSALVSMPTNLKARWTIRQQRKKLSDMETRLAELQTELDTARQISTESIALLPPAREEDQEKPSEENKPVLAGE